jgi:hypothetical protein
MTFREIAMTEIAPGGVTRVGVLAGGTMVSIGSESYDTVLSGQEVLSIIARIWAARVILQPRLVEADETVSAGGATAFTWSAKQTGGSGIDVSRVEA